MERSGWGESGEGRCWEGFKKGRYSGGNDEDDTDSQRDREANLANQIGLAAVQAVQRTAGRK